MPDEAFSDRLRPVVPALARHKRAVQGLAAAVVFFGAVAVGQSTSLPLRPLVLGTLALLVAVTLLVGWLAHRLVQPAELRRAILEAYRTLWETRRLVKRYRYRLEQAAQAQLGEACRKLEDAVLERDEDRISSGIRLLEERVERYLAFTRKGQVREYAESIAVAVLIALFLRAFVVEAFKIPSGSMIPTLEVGDHIFVNKFIYGLRIPFTDVKFFKFRKPKRGEVIVFIYPREPDKDFIKRIVAVEGDTVEIKDHRLFVNGQPVPSRKIEDRFLYTDHDEGREKLYEEWEERVRNRVYRTINEPGRGGSFELASAPWNSARLSRVPPGHVFVLGDNRDNSHDSRYWGWVPMDKIKGRAMFVWWSGDPHVDSPWQFWRRIRWDRLIKPIE